MAQIEKPTVLVVEETKQQLINVINDSRLPAFIIEPIISKIMADVEIAVKNEYEAQKKYYEENSSKNVEAQG